MINSVSTLLVNSAAARQAPPQVVPDPALNTGTGRPDFDYTISSIRVDVDADLAILEFRSVKTGDVLRQYPTEKQIAGYMRAAELEANKEARQQLYAEISTGFASGAPQPGQKIPGTSSMPVQAVNNDITAQQSAGDPTGQGGAQVNVNAGMAAQMSDTSSVSANA